MVAFNHVKVEEREAAKLKLWYMYYHKQASIYGCMLKRLQRKHVLLWSANVVCAIARTAAGATGPIAITIAVPPHC